MSERQLLRIALFQGLPTGDDKSALFDLYR